MPQKVHSLDFNIIEDEEMTSVVPPKSPVLNNISLGLSEFLGTALLTFVACMGCTEIVPNVLPPVLQQCLTTGFAVMTSIQAFGHISGAHINPAVTICAAFLGQTKWSKVPVYCVSQFAGALAGYALLIAITPKDYIDRSGGVCVVQPHEELSVMQALCVEGIITMVLCFGICGAWHPSNATKTDSVALKIGLIVSMLLMAAGPYTGGGMNPAKSFAPAVWNRKLDTVHLLYWLGPIIGGALSGLAYKHLLI